MPEWVVGWLWVGLYWLLASIVVGLIAGRLMAAGSECDSNLPPIANDF